MPQERPLDYTEAQKGIRELIDEGSIRPTTHVEEMAAERYFDDFDLLSVLSGPNKIVSDELGKDGWRYDVVGSSVDGENMRVPVEIDDEHDELVIVTAFFVLGGGANETVGVLRS